jgi:hypothetical protein
MRPKRRTRALLTATLACVIFAALNSNVVAQQPDSISSTVRSLQKVNGEAVYDSKIPPDVRDLLTRLKHQLRDLVGRTLDASVNATTPARAAQASISAALRREGVPPPRPNDDVHTFGNVISINITRPSGHPDIIAATTTISVHCGDDSSLYLFRREGEHWRLLLADEASGYEQVNGAQGSYNFRVSPPDARGDFFVVATEVTPWCTSAWQLMRYRVLRVGREAYSPRLLLRGEEGIYLGFDLEGFLLSATARAFTLRFNASQELDPGILVRPHVLKFEVADERAERVAPVALKPEDFTDEWTHMKWDEAARWSEPSRLSELKRWHAVLNKDGDGFHGLEILFVQPCGSGEREWQIGVESFLDDENRTRLPPKLYFTVSRVGGVFRMSNVSDVRPPGCPGESGRPTSGSR